MNFGRGYKQPRNKFNAHKSGGFDSRKEERRWQELRLLERAGEADAMIHDIEKTIVPSWYIKERNADMVKFLSLEDTIIPAEEGET